MSFSTKIYVGLASGIALGVFFGESMAFMHYPAEAFIELLHMTVLPYVTVSLIVGIGSLDYKHAVLMVRRVGAVLVALWILGLAMVFLMPLAFPPWETASFFSASLLERSEPFNFLELYIPANPFHSLANAVVPAVVLFSVLLGAALIGVEKKEGLLDTLHAIQRTISRANHFVVQLTPFGIFAIASHAAGTMTVHEFGRIQVYLIIYVAVALLITLWLLPGLISIVTPIKHGEVIVQTKDALITAFMTGSLFVVLPILMDKSKELLHQHKLVSHESDDVTDVIVSSSFNFPHIGKLLTLSFVLFAGWFSESVVAVSEYPKLALTGLVTLFGSTHAAIPFLLDLFEIPADLFELYLTTDIVQSRFGTLVAAMHTVTVALVGGCAVLGVLTFNVRRVFRYLGVSLALTIVTIGGARFMFSHSLHQQYDKDQIIAGMHLVRTPASVQVYRDTPPEPLPLSDRLSRLELIEERGFLRVGFFLDSLPYAFFNGAGDLVGFDVDMAHQLAGELGVELEFVPVDRTKLFEELDGSRWDVIMSGFAVTTKRARLMTLSQAYMDETLAFIVKDHRRAEFRDWQSARKLGAVTIATMPFQEITARIRKLLPDAKVRTVDTIPEFFDELGDEVDAGVMTAERGSAWSLLYPEYSVVVPQPDPLKLPLVYVVAGGDQEMAAFLDTWIELKTKDGTLRELFDYWVLGKDAEEAEPRWSVARNVLGWVD